jgi:hypothetical protein
LVVFSLFFFDWALISSVMRWKGRLWEIMKPPYDRALSSSSKSFEMARTTLILAHSSHLHRQGSVKHHCPQSRREFSEKKL